MSEVTKKYTRKIPAMTDSNVPTTSSQGQQQQTQQQNNPKEPQNVRVVVRVRPVQESQLQNTQNYEPSVIGDENQNLICLPTVNKSYQFDGVYGPLATQEDTFNCVAPLIDG